MIKEEHTKEEFIMEFIEDLMSEGLAMMILVIVLSIIVAIGLFFLFRAITCWYLKINKMLKELQNANSYLERIAIATEQNRNMATPVQPYANAQTAPQAPKQPVAPAPVAAPTPVAASTPAPAVAAASAPTATPMAAPERKCASCGSTLKEGTLFCVNCGAKAEPEA